MAWDAPFIAAFRGARQEFPEGKLKSLPSLPEGLRRWLPRGPASLRLRLQAATVLAVFAGYAALVLLSLSLDRISRRQQHQQLAERIGELLIQQPASSQSFSSQLLSAQSFPAEVRALLQPGTELKLLPAGSMQPPRLRWQGERAQLESISPLTLRDGLPRGLLLRQDVTDSMAQKTLSLQLLAAASGVSALLTCLLLRLVLRFGLARPLRILSDQLASYRSLANPPPPLEVDAQPDELRAIAATFNAMQERLTASWERQRTFVDGVAHELRTPITLISGHAQSLQRQNTVASLAPSLALITTEAQRMGAMVSDMLDLARKDAGRLHLRRQAIDAEDVLLDTFERLSARAEGRLRLQPPSEDTALPLAAGDPERLAQCLVVLIENALNYSPAPLPVRLSAEARGEVVILHVTDRGPGVPLEERELIFERFSRGGAAVNTRGSGIGLAVVQLLMEAMGGRVLVTDAPEGGADFQLHLPLYDEAGDDGVSAAGPP